MRGAVAFSLILAVAHAAAAGPPPAIPSAANPPQPAASIEPATIPVSAEADAALHVTRPGRFILETHSQTGVALQLVDRLMGPSDPAGEAGTRDARIDVLLDTGTYRLRSFAAPGATGTVRLTVAPFHDAAPPQALPMPGAVFSAPLRDGEQRAFWLSVPASGAVRIEAAGRALADLRLWRGGRDLAELLPAAHTIEPQPGHMLLDLRLEGRVEPGTYLAVAYGGPALPWADGSPDAPFHLRAGLPDTLAEGWAHGPIGPFGSERYAAPAFAGLFRLDLPHPAAAALSLDRQTVPISPASRDPHATLRGTAGHIGVIEVAGAAGQPFTLRALPPATATRLNGPGTFWVSALAAGAGGDEAPPTVLLQRAGPPESRTDRPRIIADNLPRVSATQAWRARFNLRGPTELLLDHTGGGALALSVQGVASLADIRPGRRYDQPSGYVGLRLAPEGGARGVVDITVGPPGASPEPSPPLPPDPIIPLGVQHLDAEQSLTLLAQSAPGERTGLLVRPAPVALAEAPLAVTQAAGSPPLDIPILLPAGGTLSATEPGGGDIAVTQRLVEGGLIVTLPAPGAARTVMLAWRPDRPPPATIPAPEAADATPLQPGQPVPFDLPRGGRRSFALHVPTAGLYQIGTLGRLRTRGRLATAVVPLVDAAAANGPGQNMLLQDWLRAGDYRVEVQAEESAGHLAIAASPAPLQHGATLRPGGSVRASLPAGAGVAFPVHIAAAGRYHLDIASLGDPFAVRLEDRDGWPLTRPGPLAALDQRLSPGTYRLLVAPGAVARQMAARLRLIVPPAALEGHGPHALPFGVPQTATWREPAGQADPRLPDAWTFSLIGPAEVTLRLGDGMVGTLIQPASPAGPPLARITGHWTGHLPAGSYRLDTTSLGRNDRLDYTVALTTPDLQPDQPRHVTLPATIPFTLAAPRIASLVTWGDIPLKAVLRRGDGSVVTRAGARQDDWNIALSRALPAGAYRLDLAAATPPGMAQADPNPGVPADDPADDPDPAPDSDTAGTQQVELRLLLPSPQTLPAPVIAQGALLVARASGADATVLTLERQDADGWRSVAIAQGHAPLVAAPGDGRPPPWRVRAWPIDGGTAPIAVQLRAVEMPPQPPGTIALRPADGLSLAAARVRLAAPGVLRVDGASRAAGWPGHAATPVADGQAIAQGPDIWLLGSAPGPASLEPLTVPPGADISVAVPAGGAAMLPPATPPQGHVWLWRAASGLGQPGLLANGRTGGVTAGGALIAAGGPVALRNAGGDQALRVGVTLLDLALQPAMTPGALMLPPHSAVPVRLPAGGEVTATLAPGTAIFADGAVGWAADAPLTRSLAAGAAVELVNTGAAPAPVTLAWTQAEPEAALAPGMVFKRFFGAAGSFDRRIAGRPGAQVAVAGGASLVWQGADGSVRRGRALPADGPGRVTVEHGPGAVVLSMAAPGASPWPAPAAEPVTLPRRLALSGPAMALSFAAPAPALLHATTTAPVLLALGDAPPLLFAAGAELHRVLPPGPAILRAFPVDDGPLSGTLALSMEPIRGIGEGLGSTVAVAPGHTAAFGFSVAKAAKLGLGVRAQPGRVQVRLLDAAGAVLGEGVAQFVSLPAGRYVMEVRVPPDAQPSLVRPAVLGITPRGDGPPPDVVRHYLELVGLAPQAPAPKTPESAP